MPGDQRGRRGRRRGDGLRAPVPWCRVVVAHGVPVVVALLTCVGAGPLPAPAASAAPTPAGHAAHTADMSRTDSASDVAVASHAGRALHVAGVGLGAGVANPEHVAHAGHVADTGHVAHAKVTGSEPTDGATVERAPDVVTLAVDAKPATIEGDPLQVYGPGGRRLDDNHITLADEGRRISVGLTPTLDRPAGRYEIVYRIVSADTHLIAGRLEFTTQAPVPATAALTQGAGGAGGPGAASAESDDGGLGGLLHGWPEQAWPPLIAAVALLLAGARVLWRRHRSPEGIGHGRTR